MEERQRWEQKVVALDAELGGAGSPSVASVAGGRAMSMAVELADGESFPSGAAADDVEEAQNSAQLGSLSSQGSQDNNAQGDSTNTAAAPAPASKKSESAKKESDM